MEPAGQAALAQLDHRELAARFDRPELTFVGGFENAIFDLGGGEILRLTHASHRSAEQIAGELECLAWLAERGASVARPVSDMQSVEEFIACVFERALGQKIEAGDWSEALFGNWGQLVGSLHAGSRGFEPQHPRWRWQDDGNYAFSARIPPSMPDVRAAAGEALDNMAKLATDPSQFGLVHGDAHPGNYHIQPNGRLTLFDFDDCHYSWLAYDVASVLLSVTTQPWVGASQLDREAEVRRFLPSFVRGYEREAPFAPLIAALPACLKLRELSQFAIIVDQIDAETQASDPFVSRFMQGRRA